MKIGNDKFEKICKEIVVDYFNKNVDKTDNKKLTVEDVYVVWCCKTLQNNKVLASTNAADGMYFEITYNGDKKEIYVDAYKKMKSFCVKVEE